MMHANHTSDFLAGMEDFKHFYSGQWQNIKVDEAADGHYQRVRVWSPSALRPAVGNHPKIYHHGSWQSHVIVLIHGITDSPHYMEAIGKRFHDLGFNVVLPLLPAHGVQQPAPAMRQLEHTDWLLAVDHMVNIATKLGGCVSLGGFSTGGALTVQKAIRNPEVITGGLYLFSAALDIGEKRQFILGSCVGELFGRFLDIKDWFASEVQDRLEHLTASQHDAADQNPYYGIGKNPYKYAVFFVEGASELAEVIEGIYQHYDEKQIVRFSDLVHPVFAAHSKTDESAKYTGVCGPEGIITNHPNERKKLSPIENLAHASVVLERPIGDDPEDKEYASANPGFEQMIQDMVRFTKEYVLKGR